MIDVSHKSTIRIGYPEDQKPRPESRSRFRD